MQHQLVCFGPDLTDLAHSTLGAAEELMHPHLASEQAEGAHGGFGFYQDVSKVQMTIAMMDTVLSATCPCSQSGHKQGI